METSSVSARQVMRGESQDIDFIDDAYTKALSEWNQIESLPILLISSETGVDGEEQSASPSNAVDTAAGLQEVDTAVKLITDIDIFVEYIRTLDLSAELSRIVCHADRNFLTLVARKVLLLGSKSMKKKLKHERNRIFALALRAFDNAEPVQQRMLVCIYHGLRSSADSKCPRIGCHWEEIGFQGMDPASDLRGVGILGLFQLTFFVLSQQTKQLAHDVYLLSTRKGCDFPFCVMGLNLTQIALHHLRVGTLNRQINRTCDPFLTFNLFYASLFMKLFVHWRGRNCTVVDTAFLLRDLKQSARKSVQKSIRAVSTYKGSDDQQTVGNDDVVVFSDIGNIVNPDAKDVEEGEENLV